MEVEVGDWFTMENVTYIVTSVHKSYVHLSNDTSYGFRISIESFKSYTDRYPSGKNRRTLKEDLEAIKELFI